MYIINLDNNYLIKRYRMNVILLRHGETDHNKSGLSQCGDIDTIMNEQGVKQSELTGKFLNKNYNINRIYSSTLIRARQTASIISDIIGLNSDNINYKSKLKESSKKILEQVNITKEESKKIVGQRARLVFDEIIEENINNNSDILIVSHGAVIKNLIKNLFDLREISQNVISDVGNCTLTVINIDNKKLDLKLSYDNSHLQDLYFK